MTDIMQPEEFKHFWAEFGDVFVENDISYEQSFEIIKVFTIEGVVGTDKIADSVKRFAYPGNPTASIEEELWQKESPKPTKSNVPTLAP